MDIDTAIRNAKTNRDCYLCSKPGHIMRFCPQGPNRIHGMLHEMGPSVHMSIMEELSGMVETEEEEEEELFVNEGLEEIAEDFTNGQK